MADRPAVPRHTDQLREIGSLTQRFHARLASALDLNGRALDAMEWLERDGPMTPSELSERLAVTPAAVTGIMGRLEATGHAHRERDDRDGRSVQIVPNPASLVAAAGHLGPLVDELRLRVVDYSAAEIAVVERFLDDVIAAYRAGIAALEARGGTAGGRPSA